MSAPPVVPWKWATPRDPGALTMGPAVGKLARSMRRPFMPWQTDVADTALELDSEGPGFRYSLVVVTVQRQAGKTTLLGPVMAHRLLTVERGRAWITAQLRQDARDTWQELTETIRASPLRKITTQRDTNGQERLTVRGGSTLRPFNPGDENSQHGKQSDATLCDEAWAFPREAGAKLLQGVVPTMATRPWGQLWIVSTAGTAASTWLRDYVERGREECRTGVRSRMAYFEHGIPEDADLNDMDTYVRHHPAVGHTINRRALEDARQAMGSASEFARAYGNYWTSTAEWAISPALWDRARTVEPIQPTGPLSLAVEVSADRAGGLIVMAGQLADGRAAVEVVEYRGGVGWIAPRLMEMIQRRRPVAVVIDPHGPARTVHDALTTQRSVRVPLIDFDAGDLVQAHGEFLDALTEGTAAHRTHERLDAACQAATARKVREQVVWSRDVAPDGTSPAALIAATLALYGLRHPGLAPIAPKVRTAGA